MTEPAVPPFNVVAQGNHQKGYRGVVIQDWNGENEKIVARCKHHHPTTGEARACIRASWFRGRNLDEMELP